MFSSNEVLNLCHRRARRWSIARKISQERERERGSAAALNLWVIYGFGASPFSYVYNARREEESSVKIAIDARAGRGRKREEKRDFLRKCVIGASGFLFLHAYNILIKYTYI